MDWDLYIFKFAWSKVSNVSNVTIISNVSDYSNGSNISNVSNIFNVSVAMMIRFMKALFLCSICVLVSSCVRILVSRHCLQCVSVYCLY